MKKATSFHDGGLMLPKLRVLELFAGSCSIGKAARQLGMEVRSFDINPYPGVTDVRDILGVKLSVLRDWQPDIIWASPPCTGFSVASIGRHWAGGKRAYEPKSSTALLGMALVRKTQEIIAACNPVAWFVENPRGVLRKLPLMHGFGTHHTVSYCRYGDVRMKPTDIWTNVDEWKPQAMCKNGNRKCHHEPAPRGSKTGTQGLKGAHVRSVIPHGLCMEVMRAAQRRVMSNHTGNETASGLRPSRRLVAATRP